MCVYVVDPYIYPIQNFIEIRLPPFAPPPICENARRVTGLRKFRVKKALTMGMLGSKLPLIVIVAP